MKKSLVIILIFIILAGALFFLINREIKLAIKEAGYVGEPMVLKEVITVPGLVKSKEDCEIKTLLDGQVKEVKTQVGCKVHAGDIIMELDKKDIKKQLETLYLSLMETENFYSDLLKQYNNQEKQFEIRLREAKREVELAESIFDQQKKSLEKIKHDKENAVSRAKEEVEKAKEKLKKDTYLFENNAISRKVFEESKKQYLSTKENLNYREDELKTFLENTIPATLEFYRLQVESKKDQYELLKNSFEEEEITEEDLLVARKKIEEIKNLVEEQERNLDKLKMTSPITGTVINLLVKEGDMVKGGNIVARVVNLDNIFIEVMLDGSCINGVSRSQSVLIKSSSFEEVLKGEIEYIAPVATGKGDLFYFNSRIKVDNDWGLLRPGMQVLVQIKVFEIKRREPVF